MKLLFGRVVLALAAFVAVIALAAPAQASDSGDLARATHATKCFALGKHMKLDAEELSIYRKRIKGFETHNAVSYTLGYIDGTIAGYSGAYAEHYGSYGAAVKAAASNFYKAYGCTTAGSM